MSTHSLIISPASENNPELKIDILKNKKAALVLRAVNHKLRQIILQLIGERDKITVTEIFQRLLLEQSVASQHLAILRKAGFVKTKREGKNIYYSVNRQRVKDLNQFVSNILA